MGEPLKDPEAIRRERREFDKKLKEFLAKEEELRRRETDGLDLVERSGLLRELAKIAKAIDACRGKIRRADDILQIRQGPFDGTVGSQDDEWRERAEVENAKAELEQLLVQQRKEIERLTELLTAIGQKTTVSADDAAALEKAVQDAMTEMGRRESATWRLREDLDRLKKDLKEHGDKAGVDKCGAQCENPRYGLCDNPAVRDGRCWIPEHQAQPR